MLKRNTVLILLASISFIVLILCIVFVPLANFSVTLPTIDDSLTAQTWHLELIGSEEVQKQIYIKFLADGKVGGFSGCNNFAGSYEATGGKLQLSALAVTKKACIDNQDEETIVLKALTETTEYKILDENLLLISPTVNLTFSKNINISSGIEGTWKLFKSVNNEVEKIISSDINASIKFDLDGTVGGQICNSFGGTYTLGEVENTISFSQIASTLMFCTSPDGSMDVESTMLRSLEEAETYSILDQNTLRIYSGDNSYLEFIREQIQL